MEVARELTVLLCLDKVEYKNMFILNHEEILRSELLGLMEDDEDEDEDDDEGEDEVDEKDEDEVDDEE